VAKAVGVAAQPAGAVKPFNTVVNVLFVGGSIYAGKIDSTLRTFLKGLTSEQVKRVAVFGSAAGNKSALNEVRNILKDSGIEVCDEAFQCRGSFLLANKGHPNQGDLTAAAQFAKKTVRN
jgi:flavorubredoxin